RSKRDWSSDVCSSDLGDEADLLGNSGGQAARIVGVGGSGRGREVDAEGVDSGPGQFVQALAEAAVGGGDEQLRTGAGRGQGRIQIGRASCRERAERTR